MFNGNSSDTFGAGTNWGNALAGALGAFDQRSKNRDSKGNYYVESNWRGDGLADSKLGFKGNPYYSEKNKSLASAVGLANALRQNRYSYPTDTTGSYNGGIMDNNYTYALLKNALPSIGSIFSEQPNTTIDNYTGGSFNYPTYINGGTFGSFGNSVNDFLGDGYTSQFAKGI